MKLSCFSLHETYLFCLIRNLFVLLYMKLSCLLNKKLSCLALYEYWSSCFIQNIAVLLDMKLSYLSFFVSLLLFIVLSATFFGQLKKKIQGRLSQVQNEFPFIVLFYEAALKSYIAFKFSPVFKQCNFISEGKGRTCFLGKNFLFLAALAILQQDDLKSRLICTRIS